MSRFRNPANEQAHGIGSLRDIWAVLNKFFKGGLLNVSPDTVRGRVSRFGTGTIANATTSVAVTHGCGFTPTIDMIRVTASNNPTNDPGWLYVDTIGATQFTVRCRADPGATGLTFGWAVDSL